MNKFTRFDLSAIRDKLEDINSQIVDIECDEQNKFDNLSANLQNSEMAERMSNCINNLQDFQSLIEDAISLIDDVLYY